MITELDDQFSLSVLVATCDRWGLIVSCLESLYNQEIKPQEVIILDQSDDPRNTARLCSLFGFSHIKLSEKNKSNAINLGVSLSCGNYVAVIDDDCIAKKDWIKTIIVSLTAHPNSIITGRVIAGEIEPNAVQSRLDDSLDEPRSYKKKITTPIFIFSGCNFILRKEIFQHVGLFDLRLGPGSKFLSSDDNEWSYRALNLGYRIFYDPSVIVQHRSWRSQKDDLAQMQAYGYAAGAFFKIIFRTSKLDFISHSLQLISWIIWTYLTSKSTERRAILSYSRNFLKGIIDFT